MKENPQKKILLHICCAPCGTYSIERMREDGWEVTGYFYNPNIYPQEEYEKRVQEIKEYCRRVDMDLIIGDYDSIDWELHVKEYAHLGEGSERCRRCIGYRISNTMDLALKMNLSHVTSTLTISPHKNSRMIFQLAESLGVEKRVVFQEYNFKKKNGFRKSVKISRECGMYRQDYCGCQYSQRESLDRKKVQAQKKNEGI